MKAKLMIFIIAYILAMPVIASAKALVPDTKVDNQEQLNHVDNPRKHEDWQAKREEREKQLLGWVDQFTPDKKEEWTKVLEDKKQLRNQWLSPENAEKRGQWKSEKIKRKKELHKQLEEGKITKEEFIKQIHGGKDIGYWKTFNDLKIAVNLKDDKKVAETLNQLLEQYKQHNAKLKEKLTN